MRKCMSMCVHVRVGVNDNWGEGVYMSLFMSVFILKIQVTNFGGRKRRETMCTCFSVLSNLRMVNITKVCTWDRQ